MHVIIATLGSSGDVHPFVALGRTLRDRGHEVVVIANDTFAELVTNAGLEFASHGSEADYRRAIEDPNLWHPLKGLKLVMQQAVAPALLPTVEAIRARRREDTVLVNGSLAFGARVAQEADGLPLATVHLAPSSIQSVHRVPRFAGMPVADWTPKWWKRFWWWFGDKTVDPMIAPQLNEVRARFGLAPVRRIFQSWLHSPDRVIGMFPEWFGPPQPDWPAQTRLIGFPLFDGGEKPFDETWLDAGDPPIVFTAGSANVTADGFFRESIEVCRLLDKRGLFITTHEPHGLPDNIRWERYVPFSRLLPRAAALVSHGGVGTMSQGIAAGVPQLVTPLAFDQFDNASRLEDLGVGATLPMRKYKAARAAAALTRLLDDSAMIARCRELRGRLSDGPLENAADLVEGLRPGGT